MQRKGSRALSRERRLSEREPAAEGMEVCVGVVGFASSTFTFLSTGTPSLAHVTGALWCRETRALCRDRVISISILGASASLCHGAFHVLVLLLSLARNCPSQCASGHQDLRLRSRGTVWIFWEIPWCGLQGLRPPYLLVKILVKSGSFWGAAGGKWGRDAKKL